MTKPIEPKSCPFCGGRAHVRRALHVTWIVECLDWCERAEDAFTHDEDRAEAIAKWNRRTPCAED